MGNHPIFTGSIVGILEIAVTFPFEYVKRQLQLQQQSSALARAAPVHFAGPFHCAHYTIHTQGLRGLYVGFSPFFVFSGPKSAMRWGSFEALSSIAGTSGLHGRDRVATDTACGFVAGLIEAALGQTPNQVSPPDTAVPQLPRT